MSEFSRNGKTFMLEDTDEDDDSIEVTEVHNANQRAILIDSSDSEADKDDSNGKNDSDTGIEKHMSSLTLEKPRRLRKFRKKDKTKLRRQQPKGTQLSLLNFDSDSSKSTSQYEAKKKNIRREAIINLVDTDSEDENGPNQSDAVSSTSSVLLSPTASTVSSILLSPTASTSSSSGAIFEMKTPSPCNSAISFKEEKEGNKSPSSIDSDVNEDTETVWRRKKSGAYVLDGTCSISGNAKWPKMNIPKKLYDKLYDHQKIGVQFLASLHSKKIGGILGDDMGLGKTYQTCTLLGGLMRAGTIRNALIISPVVVMKNWERESRMILEKFCGVRVSILNIDSSIKRERRAMLLEEALKW